MASDTSAPPVNSSTKVTTRQKAFSHPFGSAPLSYLFDASVDMDRSLAPLRIVTASKYALSIKRFCVVELTAVPSPPIIPASAMGSLPSVINKCSSFKLCFCSSRVVNVSPDFALRTSISLFFSLS